jgi:hypothetical protein
VKREKQKAKSRPSRGVGETGAGYEVPERV